MTDNEYQIYWREQFEVSQREIAEMAMRQAVLVAVLKEVEWVERICPWCFWCDEGHKPDCHRQLALERCKNVADKKEDAVKASPITVLTQDG